ncbi:MAG TPA: glycogen synthase GlgA [Planctomycetota bacterium]|nr:glycogen synthase GlgA [Planctomycetota bacterium]
MNVAFISSEVVPFSKTGGLADVAGSLPDALERLGVNVNVVSPLYPSVRRHPLEQQPNLVTVPLGGSTEWGAVRKSGHFHFLEHDRFYSRGGLYGNGNGEYGDNARRFVFLMRGALDYLSQIGRPPDIIHVHDWQTGLVPLYLKTLYSERFPNTKSVLTVHNLAYQGRFWKGELPMTGIGWHRFNFQDLEHYDDLNFLKGGLVHADALTTVSPTYAHEIQRSEFGFGLDGVIRSRAKQLRGILNGIDVDEWNPEKDPHLPMRFSSTSLAGKARCKASLQQRFGLPERPEVPLFCIVGRLAEQKGIDLFLRAADTILRDDLQIVILGSGEDHIQRGVDHLAWRHRGKVAVYIGFDNGLAHQLLAGGDALLVPSRYEPCGLTQLYALRYGTLPVVRSTGGLVDTVEPGVTGVRFDHYTPEGLEWAVREALAIYRTPERWKAMQQAGMGKDYSWEASAREYLKLYFSLIGN